MAIILISRQSGLKNKFICVSHDTLHQRVNNCFYKRFRKGALQEVPSAAPP